MAIERAAAGYGPRGAGVAVAGSPEGGETVQIPASILGGQEVSPGDVIRLEVVSMNGDMVVVKYAAPEDEAAEAPEAEAPGSDQLAAEFENAPAQM